MFSSRGCSSHQHRYKLLKCCIHIYLVVWLCGCVAGPAAATTCYCCFTFSAKGHLSSTCLTNFAQPKACSGLCTCSTSLEVASEPANLIFTHPMVMVCHSIAIGPSSFVWTCYCFLVICIQFSSLHGDRCCTEGYTRHRMWLSAGHTPMHHQLGFCSTPCTASAAGDLWCRVFKR